MKNKTTIFTIIVIITTFIQGLILFIERIEKTEDTVSVIAVVQEKTTYLKEIDLLLSNLRNYNVISRIKSENSWMINMKIEGTLEEIKRDLTQLDKFIIESYNININNEKAEVYLELKSR